MPIDLNGQNIGDITLNGNAIGEVTVNGQIVFTSGPNSGSKIYLLDDQEARLSTFDLPTPHDITNLSNRQDVNADRIRPHGIAWRQDTGDRFWITYNEFPQVDQYDTNTPFVIQKNNQTTITLDDRINGIHWKPDGTRFFAVFQEDDTAKEYSVSTNFDIGSTVTQQVTRSLPSVPRGLTFSGDGLTMFIVLFDTGFDKIRQFTLSSPHSLASVSSFTDILPGDLGLNSNIAEGVAISDDGLNFYIFQRDDILHHFALNSANDLTGGFTRTTVNLGINDFPRAGEVGIIR